MSSADQHIQGNEMHLLVVDDDTRIRQLLVSFLQENGFLVSSAADAETAIKRMKSIIFDLVVLDVMMPGISGIELTRQLRAARIEVPILFLSALAESDDRIEGLASGGDDYLAKPFEPRELLLRINNLLKRRGNDSNLSQTVSFGPFVFNPARGELTRDDKPVRLTTRESDMLKILARSAGNTVSRADLAAPGSNENTRGVDVQVNRLRSKIEDDPSMPVYLQTVRGRGYVLFVD